MLSLLLAAEIAKLGAAQQFAKLSYGLLYRGFESPSLRQINESYKKIGFFSGLFILSGSSR